MNIQGVVVCGVVKGLRARTWNGEVKGYELGISCQVADGFGGYSEDLKIIRVPENQKQAVENAVTKLRGKHALVQVEVSAYAGKGAAVAQLNYVADSVMVNLDEVDPFSGELAEAPKKELKAAS